MGLIPAGATSSGIVALAIFIVVLVLIVLRNVRGGTFPIWTAMMIGAGLMIITGVLEVTDAYNAIDFDVLFFLIGMFSIVAGMEHSGLLAYLTYRILSGAKRTRWVLTVFVIMMGVLSAFTVNDTMAVMGTPIAITVIKQIGLPPELVLVVLAFSITTGSVMTPLGNPQNMLIASESGMAEPFLKFLTVLSLPTLLNLFFIVGFLWLMLMRRGRHIDGRQTVVIAEEHIRSRNLAWLSGASLCLAVGGFLLNDFLSLVGLPHTQHLGVIAFLSAVPLYAIASERRELLHSVDWSTITFFISMFIVMQGLWSSGAAGLMLGFIPTPSPTDRVRSILNIMLVGVALSQVFSNVPLVKLYIGVMKGLGFESSHNYAWLTLAAGSTIAGNLTVLGAASNVIIIEASENRTGRSFSFTYFLKLGVVMTALNVATYTLWLIYFG